MAAAALLLSMILITLSIVDGVRVPRNPCPDVLSYYKSPVNGDIYGEAVIPYDNAEMMVFNVNASLAGIVSNAKFKMQLTTSVKDLLSAATVNYQIYFPSQTILPKITQIKYNGHVHCSGPPEPLLPGTEGTMNLWSSHIFTYMRPKPYELNHEGEQDSNQVPVKPQRSQNSRTTATNSIPVITTTTAAPTTTTAPRTTITTASTTTTTPTSTKPSISKESENQQCGISTSVSSKIQFRLLDSTDSMEGQYPWVAAVFAYQPRTSGYNYKCTANLISNSHVITAARCVQYYKIQTVSTEDLLIVMATRDLTRWPTNGAITRGVDKVQVHPEFMDTTTSAHADIAVMTLAKPITITDSVRPVCLWQSFNSDLLPYVDKMGVITGWSTNKNQVPSIGEVNAPVIQFVELPIVSQFECVKADSSVYSFISNKTFCVGDKSGRGPCIGDSGAGFVLPFQGVYHLRGIASLSISKDGVCDLKSKHAIFCDVAQYVDWVKSCMNEILIE